MADSVRPAARAGLESLCWGFLNPSEFLHNTGFVLGGFPAMGACVSYTLRAENENLPAFVVLPDPNSHT